MDKATNLDLGISSVGLYPNCFIFPHVVECVKKLFICFGNLAVNERDTFKEKDYNFETKEIYQCVYLIN